MSYKLKVFMFSDTSYPMCSKTTADLVPRKANFLFLQDQQSAHYLNSAMFIQKRQKLPPKKIFHTLPMKISYRLLFSSLRLTFSKKIIVRCFLVLVYYGRHL
uniref:Uncharacterized protein n=1 Tax=Rhizophora mucronata TaxID=61149 RepID=A0A2P2QNZ3_RHIMU